MGVKRSPGIKVSLAAPALNRATHRRTFACRPETRAKDPEPGILTALAASSLTNTALHFTRGSRITALSVEAIPSLGHRIGLRIHPGTRALNSAGHMTDVTDVSSPSSDLFCTLTPDSYSPRRRVGGCPVVTLEEIEGSASPALKNKDSIMPSKVQRTPQPPLTQAKLTGTGMLQLQSPRHLGSSTHRHWYPRTLAERARPRWRSPPRQWTPLSLQQVVHRELQPIRNISLNRSTPA